MSRRRIDADHEVQVRDNGCQVGEVTGVVTKVLK